MSLLLDFGANLETRDWLVTAATPLHAAVSMGHEHVVELLCERGADLDARDQSNRTPFFAAVQGRRFAVIDVLLRHGASTETASGNGGDGHRPLTYCAATNDVEVAELLLARGANIEARAANMSAVTIAAKRGHVDMIRLLARRGASLEPHARGFNALEVAAQYGQLEACLVLINPLGMDPAALAAGVSSALSLYGRQLDRNDPAHPPVPPDPNWRPRLTDADKAEARAQLVAARAEFLLQKKRDENWARRRVFLQTLLAGGLRHSAAQKAAQAALQAAVDTSAALPAVPRDREYLKQQVLGHEGVVRRVASFI